LADSVGIYCIYDKYIKLILRKLVWSDWGWRCGWCIYTTEGGLLVMIIMHEKLNRYKN
jgi:hypothetical protein